MTAPGSRHLSVWCSTWLYPLTCSLVGTLRWLFQVLGSPIAPSAVTGSSTGVFPSPLGHRRFTRSLRGPPLSSGRAPSMGTSGQSLPHPSPAPLMGADSPMGVYSQAIVFSESSSPTGPGSLRGPFCGSLVASHTGLYTEVLLACGLYQSCLWLHSSTDLLLLKLCRCTDHRWDLAQQNPGIRTAIMTQRALWGLRCLGFRVENLAQQPKVPEA